MTLYYSGVEDGHNGDEGVEQIIENHPEYVHFDDEGRLVLNLDEMYEDKRKEWAQVGVTAVQHSDEWEVETPPSFNWVGSNDE